MRIAGSVFLRMVMVVLVVVGVAALVRVIDVMFVVVPCVLSAGIVEGVFVAMPVVVLIVVDIGVGGRDQYAVFGDAVNVVGGDRGECGAVYGRGCVECRGRCGACGCGDQAVAPWGWRA